MDSPGLSVEDAADMPIHHVQTLSDAQYAERERIVQQFQRDWSQGRKPEIESFLPQDSGLRRSTLISLVRAEIDLRQKAGEEVQPESYVERFPELQGIQLAVENHHASSRESKATPTMKMVKESELSAKDVLCGVLACRLQFVTKDELVTALEEWLRDKQRPLIDVFLSRGNLTPSRRKLLEAVMAEHLDKHDQDAEKSLAAVGTIELLGTGLHWVSEDEISDEQETIIHSAGVSTSAGTRFRIVRPHCKGGLGQISIALDEELHREVALKEIQDEHASDSRGCERFLLEAEITGSLEHPGVVPVYGLGQYPDGRPFYAMRFIKGDSLKSAIADYHRPEHPTRSSPGQRQLELRKLLARFIDVCNTIEYAHSRGVIHRDLKPSNIMLGKYGETLVVDWGLAKMLGKKEIVSDEVTLRLGSDKGSSIQTIPGSVLGTPAYMSPEQAEGDRENLGPATDIYSLGATLYHLLTDRPPYQGQAWDVIQAVQKGNFPRPRQENAEVPLPLEMICLKAMSLRAVDRYRSPRDLADDIEHWLADEPVSALRDTPIQRLGRLARRHRTVAIVGTAALIVIAAVSLVSLVIINGHLQVADRERQRAEELAKSEMDARENAQVHAAAESNARRIAEEMNIDLYLTLGNAAHNERLPEVALLWFAEAAKSAHQTAEMANRVRFTAWRQQVPYPVRAFWHPSTNIKQLAFSPCGQYLLVLGESDVVVWELETAKRLTLPEGYDARTTAASWNHAGDRFVLGTNEGEVAIVAFPSGEVQSRFNRGKPVNAVAFSPDDRLLAIASDEVALWDCNSRNQRGIFTHPKPVKKLVFSPDGNKLATACADGLARVFDVTNLGPDSSPILPPLMNRPPANDPSDLSTPLFLKDGSILVTHSDRGVLEFTDLQQKQSLQRLDVHDILHDIVGFITNPREEHLLIYGNKFTAFCNLSQGRADTPLEQYRHKNWITGLAFSPDGKTLFSTGKDRTARFWPSVNPPNVSVDELFTTVPHENDVSHGTFENAGRYFATAQTDGLVRVWKTHSSPDHEIDTGAETPYLARLSPSGRFVISAGWRRQRGVSRTQVFATETGLAAGPWLQTRGAVNDAAFAPDDQHVITLSSSSDPQGIQMYEDVDFEQPGWIQCWNWQTGREVFKPIATDVEPIRVAVSPRGNIAIVICTDGSIVGVEVKTGRQLYNKRHPGMFRRDVLPPQQMVKFSSDGRSFATWGIGVEARVWESATGKSQKEITLGDLCWDVDFSPTGDQIVTGSFDKTATIWDLRSQQPLMIWEHPDRVHSVRFNPEGNHLVTSCRDRMTRVWDLSKQEPVSSVQHGDEGWIARYSMNGRWIMTDSRHNHLRVWDPLTGKPVTPPIPIEASQGVIELTADGRRAVLAGSKIHVFDLNRLLYPGPAGQSSDEIGLLGEILSGRRIVAGGSMVNLSTAEWLERWRRCPLKPLDAEW